MMTDNKITKALECCTKRENQCCNDAECPLFYKTVTYSECRWKLLKETTDLINRQKAEIERLQTVKKHIQNLILRDCDYPDPESYNNAFKKALERLHNNCNIKAEATISFAKRLCDGRVSNDPVVIAAEALLKELTEDKP